MADHVQSEERYPLLFLFLDDSNKSTRKNRNVFLERSRSQGIMSGATTVLTQWPGHLSSCGLAMVVVIMTVLFFFLMLIASTIKPVTNTIHSKCLKKSSSDFETNLFLVHDDSAWQENELAILETILSRYTQCHIELLILRKETYTYHEEHKFVKHKQLKRHTKQHRRHIARKNHTEEKFDLDINIGARKLLKAFLERRRHLNSTITNVTTSTTNIPLIPNLSDTLIKFPRVIVKNMTEREFFENSPLYDVWKILNKETLNFAARILKLWENGGITFEIPHIPSRNTVTFYNYETVQGNSSRNVTVTNATTVPVLWNNISLSETNKLLQNMISIGYTSFHNLPKGLVTVDEEGIHMETKTTCHAFFGEALMQLKHAKNVTTVSEIIRNTLRNFCVKGAVDAEYCNSI